MILLPPFRGSFVNVPVNQNKPLPQIYVGRVRAFTESRQVLKKISVLMFNSPKNALADVQTQSEVMLVNVGFFEPERLHHLPVVTTVINLIFAVGTF